MIDIAQDMMDYVAARRGPRRASTTVRASQIGHPCERYLAYEMVEPAKARSIPVGLQATMETGTHLHPLMFRILAEVGEHARPQWRLVGSEASIQDRLLQQHGISGHCDGMIQEQDDQQWRTLAACDVKTCSPNVFRAINCLADLRKYTWAHKWQDQLYVYAFAWNLDRCCLLLVNKTCIYQVKTLWFDLDMGRMEELLGKAARIHAAAWRYHGSHNQPNALPPKINRADYCRGCDYEHICMPELVSPDTSVITDPELEELIARRIELSVAHAEYAAIDRRLKEALPETNSVIVGRYLVEAEQVERREYTVKASSYWKRKFHNLEPAGIFFPFAGRAAVENGTNAPPA